MSKVDLKKDLKHLYNPSAKEVSVVDVPPMNFLMIDGAGDPNVSLEYRQAMEALFSLSYALKFRIKKCNGLDYAVMPLEGLWWTDDPSQFSMNNKGIWKWTAMIMQPEYVTGELLAEALAEVRKKKDLAVLDRVRFESYHEGLSAQIMHIGPYAAEEPTIARLHRFIRENGYELRGKHHEIYLSDPRRTAPEKLRTVLRQPVQKQA
ncbi:MAG TPA: hypothetical protein ENI39_02060 [Anaerolineae bacterium]|nr:hypothetical protein [Anaerolineae bacterium]